MKTSNMSGVAVVLICAAGLAITSSAALAQDYPVESQLRFEVWDGSAWTSNVFARPGDRVEVRAVVSYTGPNTAILGLGELLYQPVFSNWDNDGPSQDDLGAWRNGGYTGFGVPGSMLSAAEGATGSQLASYGRVGFGATGSSTRAMNIITSHRHTGGSNGAPAGSYLRVAGSSVTQWAQMHPEPWTAEAGNRVLRGLSAYQLSQIIPITGATNTNWQGGTTDLVIFRQAVLLSDLNASRTISISSEEAFLRRGSNAIGSTDDRRYIAWYTQMSGSATSDYRSGVDFVAGSITVLPFVPAPGTAAMLGVGVIVAIRRRR